MIKCKKGKPLARRLHDVYADVCQLIKLPLVETEIAEGTLFSVQEAGECVLLNNDESNFYGLENSKVIYSWPTRAGIVLKNVRVVGDQGFVYLKDGSLLRGVWAGLNPSWAKVRRPINILSTKTKKTFFHLTGFNHENHGHFVLQHLPRLLAAQQSIPNNARTFSILLAPNHLKWQSRYLLPLGYSHEQLKETTYGTQQIEELIMVPFLHENSALVNPLFYKKIHAALVATKLKEATYGKPLFLSREDAPDKKLSNEKEVIEECRKLWPDLVTVKLSEHSADTQEAIFRDAPWIIGPQGQAWTSQLLANKSRCIILGFDGRPPQGWAADYRNLGLICGHRVIALTLPTGLDNLLNWEYPLEQLKEDLAKAKSILSRDSPHE